MNFLVDPKVNVDLKVNVVCSVEKKKRFFFN